MSVTAARRGSLRDAPGVVGTTLARIEPATALLALVTLGALALRATQMNQSLFGDEVWTYQDVHGRSLAAVLRTVHTGAENSPPLFFVLSWVSAKLGDPSVWIRLPSLILGTATIPLIYAIGRQTVGRVPGLLGAAIVAASPFSIYYGIEARPYATMAFFVALSTLALLRAIRSGSRWWWLVYVLASAAAAYTHYTVIFVLAMQAAWSLWMCRDRLREPLLANVAVALLYIPWLPQLRGKGLTAIGFLWPLNFHNVVKDVLRLIPGYPYAPLSAIPTLAGMAAIGACVALGLLTVAQRWRRGSQPPEHRAEKLLIVLLAVSTPVGLLLYSLVGTDLWLARGLYASLPAAALILGALLWAVPRTVRPMAIVVVFVALIAGSVRAISPSYARPPFRAAAAYLDRVAPRNAPIILYPSFVDVSIPTQFKNPHLVRNASTAAWRNAARATRVYAIIDNDVAVRYGMPRPPGFELTAARQYKGLVWFELLTYRSVRPAVSRTR